MKNKIIFIICIIISTIIICFISLNNRNLDNGKCEYNGMHIDLGQAYFTYKCGICGKGAENSGSNPDKLCRECSKEYGRCVTCTKKVE